MKFYPHKKAIEFKVGVFSLLAIIGLIAGYTWLTNSLEMQNYQRVQISFQQAAGLEKGTGVYIRGINCGKVSKVRLRRADVLVDILLRDEINLTQNSSFIITDSGLVGSKIIKIVLAENSQPLDLEKIQQGENSPQLADLITQAGNLMGRLTQLFAEDAEFISDLENMVANGNATFQKMDNLISQNSADLTETIQNMQQTSADLQQIITENKSEFSASKDLLIALQNTIQQIDNSFAQIDTILSAVQDQPSSFNKLLTEDELYENLLESSQNLDSLLVDIKKNPRRYFKLF
jgi:phospholipid/cholesterol/gamma-HCH transport system substrate-binding protein